MRRALVWVSVAVLLLVVLYRVLGPEAAVWKNQANKRNFVHLASGVEDFHRVERRPPDSLDELLSRFPNLEEFRFDPWGTPYIYELDTSGESFVLRALGADEFSPHDDRVIECSLVDD